jgi:branched-chain amino acid transport system ATP-binding protein
VIDDGLVVSGLVVRYGGLVAVDGVNLTAPPGRVTGLIGPNGAGKTTVFNVVTGYVRPVAGQVLIGGELVPQGRPAAVARLGVRRTFQTPRLVGELSVEANVLAGLDARLRGGGGLAEFLGLSRTMREARDRVRELLDAFGLAARAGEPAANLPLPGSRPPTSTGSSNRSPASVSATAWPS